MDGHLTIARQPEQSIDIDGPCRIKITRIARNYVRINIIADQSTNIVRTELLPIEMQEMPVCELYSSLLSPPST
jgi:sRNA-binding carbon storage regulator CsrA